MSVILGISMVGGSSKVNKDENIATVNGSGIIVGNYEKVLGLNKQSMDCLLYTSTIIYMIEYI